MGHFTISEGDKLEIKQTNKTSTWVNGKLPNSYYEEVK